MPILRSLFHVTGNPFRRTEMSRMRSDGFIREARQPERLYAIGDVHGRLDLLRTLEKTILKDCAGCEDVEIVLLGDIIDRGPHSAGVIDHLLAPLPSGVRRRVIAGNHEVMMLRFLDDAKKNLAWLDFGGLATLASYGLPHEALNFSGKSNAGTKRLLQSFVPDEHVAFLRTLPLMIEYPDCIAVHAGLRPGIALESQSAEDLISIRDGFLECETSFGKWVVHGHTPVEKPEICLERINVDTGAYAKGKLSAVCLPRQGDVFFLSASQENHPTRSQ